MKEINVVTLNSRPITAKEHETYFFAYEEHIRNSQLAALRVPIEYFTVNVQLKPKKQYKWKKL